MSFDKCPSIAEDCKYYDSSMGCHNSTHHEYWPKSRYKEKVARQFRDLDAHKHLICRALHDEIHATTQPPKKPKRAEMLEALNVNQ